MKEHDISGSWECVLCKYHFNHSHWDNDLQSNRRDTNGTVWFQMGLMCIQICTIDLPQHVWLTLMSLWTFTGPKEILVAVWVFLINNLHLWGMQFHILNNISFPFLSSLLHLFFLFLTWVQDLFISCESDIFHLVLWMISANHQTGSHTGTENTLTSDLFSPFRYLS